MEPVAVGFHFLRGAASVHPLDHLHTYGIGDRHVQITGHILSKGKGEGDITTQQ